MNKKPSSTSTMIGESSVVARKTETPPPAELEPSDVELVNRSRDGDTRAFDELVIRYRGRVYAMIIQMVKSEADAWDLAQETFIKAWRALPKFQARSTFYTWLYRIAHNVTYDWLRKKKIRTGEEFDDGVQAAVEPGAPTAPIPTPRPDQHLRHTEIRTCIEEAIAQLSPTHREVILLKEIDGYQYQEIADIMGCSIGTVMSRLFYARKKLQSLLKDVYESI